MFWGYDNLWKNKFNVNKITKVEAEYLVVGTNIEMLINLLKKEGIAIFGVKTLKNRHFIIRIKVIDERKFFAITNNLCYNVKKVRNMGLLKGVYSLLVNPGILVGILLFIGCLVILSDLVFGISFYGNGRIYSQQVKEFLMEKGIGEFSSFSSIDTKKLSSEILSQNPNFSFVNCKKVGNNLSIELILSTPKTHVNTNRQKDMISSVDGVIDKIYLYQGTALFSVGDSVKVGDVLVGGYATIREKQVEVNALAVVVVKQYKNYTYILDKENLEDYASILALNEREDGKVVGIKKEKKNNKYYFKVDVEYKITLYTG